MQDRNFVPQAGPGCHIANYYLDDSNNDAKCCCWILEWEEQVDPNELEYDGAEIPDVAIDTDEWTLTLCNIQTDFVVAYISVYETKLRDRNGNVLEQGTSTDNEGDTKAVTTLIVLCPPCTFAHLCYLHDVPPSLLNGDTHNDNLSLLLEDYIKIESDVQIWNRHPNPADTHTRSIGFPLGINKEQGDNNFEQDDTSTSTSFYCTQGEGGQLTHFFAGNLHAIDFRCPVGTPLLAVADGVVVEANDKNRLTGISVNNLFKWNSILIRVDDSADDETAARESSSTTMSLVGHHTTKGGPLFVEYVHIQSACVKAGDKVKRGQVIGTSGSVGFSPEPHLHFAAYRSAESTASTVRVFFEGKDSSGQITHFLPRAGQWYSCNGLVEETLHANE